MVLAYFLAEIRACYHDNNHLYEEKSKVVSPEKKQHILMSKHIDAVTLYPTEIIAANRGLYPLT